MFEFRQHDTEAVCFRSNFINASEFLLTVSLPKACIYACIVYDTGKIKPATQKVKC